MFLRGIGHLNHDSIRRAYERGFFDLIRPDWAYEVFYCDSKDVDQVIENVIAKIALCQKYQELMREIITMVNSHRVSCPADAIFRDHSFLRHERTMENLVTGDANRKSVLTSAATELGYFTGHLVSKRDGGAAVSFFYDPHSLVKKLLQKLNEADFTKEAEVKPAASPRG